MPAPFVFLRGDAFDRGYSGYNCYSGEGGAVLQEQGEGVILQGRREQGRMGADNGGIFGVGIG